MKDTINDICTIIIFKCKVIFLMISLTLSFNIKSIHSWDTQCCMPYKTIS